MFLALYDDSFLQNIKDNHNRLCQSEIQQHTFLDLQRTHNYQLKSFLLICFPAHLLLIEFSICKARQHELQRENYPDNMELYEAAFFCTLKRTSPQECAESFHNYYDLYKDLYFYTSKQNNLVSIMIKTNLDKIKYIGNKDKGELIKDRTLETEKKIILGFGVNAGKKHGVSSIYCYYIDKSKFGIIKYR